MTTQVSPPCSRLSLPGGNSGKASVVGGVVVDVVVDVVVEDVVVEVDGVVVVGSSAGSTTVVSTVVPSLHAATDTARAQASVIVLM